MCDHLPQATTCPNRVCADFWIQNSRLFPVFFPKQKFLFQGWRLSNRWSIQTLKSRNKAFLSRPLQTYGRDWTRFDQHKKEKYTCEALSHFFKTIFPDFISLFQTFSRSGKLLAKFRGFFKNSRLFTNPIQNTKHFQDKCLQLEPLVNDHLL